MMAKPMKTLELHYPMIQFLTINIIVNYLTGNSPQLHFLNMFPETTSGCWKADIMLRDTRVLWEPR